MVILLRILAVLAENDSASKVSDSSVVPAADKPVELKTSRMKFTLVIIICIKQKNQALPKDKVVNHLARKEAKSSKRIVFQLLARLQTKTNKKD